LLHQGRAVELGPDVGHAAVPEPVEVHALDPDGLAGRGQAHELLLQGTGHHPAGGHGVAAGHDLLQVLLDVGEERLELRDLLLEPGQGRLVAGRGVVIDQARVGELVDGGLVGRSETVLETGGDLGVVQGHGRLS